MLTCLPVALPGLESEVTRLDGGQMITFKCDPFKDLPALSTGTVEMKAHVHLDLRMSLSCLVVHPRKNCRDAFANV